MVQFTGGHDVSPGSYGEAIHQNTWSWPNRDIYERVIYDICLRNFIPMIGICRGGQFLNVCNKGGMWQDVDGHSLPGTHPAACKLGEDTIQVSSTHHQMMRPHKSAQILMTARTATYKERMTKNGELIKVMNDHEDIEACIYHDTRSICFQPHPEYTHISNISQCRDRYFNYLETYFGLRA